MVLDDSSLDALNPLPHPETGMNLQILFTVDGPIAVMGDGAALPCYQTLVYYDFFDLLTGITAPDKGVANFSLPAQYTIAPSRLQALANIPVAAPPPVPSPP